MEEMGEESSRYPWQDYDLSFGEELMRELLDETTTTAPSPAATAAGAASADNSSSSNKGIEDEVEAEEGPTARRRESMVNRLMSTVYSGPTLSDIESALSFTGAGAGDPLDGRSKYHYSPSSPVYVTHIYAKNNHIRTILRRCKLNLDICVEMIQGFLAGEGAGQDGEQVHDEDQELRQRARRRWVQVEEIRTESHQEQPQPKVITIYNFSTYLPVSW